MNAMLYDAVGQRISWTLVHSLWQFTLVAVVVGIGLRMTQRRSPHWRYGFMFAAMLLMAVLPVGTFLSVVPDVPSRSSQVGNPPIDITRNAHTASRDGGSVPVVRSDIAQIEYDLPFAADPVHVPVAEVSGATPTTEKVRASIANFVVRWMNVILACWLGGIAVHSLRPLIGWRATGILRSQGQTDVSDSIKAVTTGVARRLGVRRAIKIAQSTLVEVPTVIGWLKPLVLLPVSAVVGLPPQQLEAVIAHELAHVRRHDYLVNLFQLAMETLFFYHPAVWWVSHGIRVERESCCDEIAAGLTGDRVGYAKLLVWLEETRQHPMKQSLAISSDGGSLLARVRRLASTPSPATGFAPLVSAAVLAVVAGAICLVSYNVSNLFGEGARPAGSSDTTQIRNWLTRAIELEQWGQLPGLTGRLAENGEFDEAMGWLSKPPLGRTKEGKFSPGTYSKAVGDICEIALKHDRPQIALDALDRLTDPNGTPRSTKMDRFSTMGYYRAVGETRAAILIHYVSKAQFDAALAFLDSLPAGTHGKMVTDVAAKLPSLGLGNRVETFWPQLPDPKLQDACRFRLANAYYHLHQPDKIWQLADQITKLNPEDLSAEVRTRNTAMISYSRVAPGRFDQLLPMFRNKINQLPAAGQSRYWDDMALAAARLQRYELTAELSAKVPLLIGTEYQLMDLSGRDRHPILFATTELLKRHQFDQVFALIDLIEDEAVVLAALARVPETIIANGEAKELPDVYDESVKRLVAAYQAFTATHDESTLRSTCPKLPEMLNVHLRRLANPSMPPDKVAFLNRDLLELSGPHTHLLIEQGKIDEVADLAEELLNKSEVGFSKWIARELAKLGHADAFKSLRAKINDAQAKSETKKPGTPLPPWDQRQFLAQSAHSAYVAGQRDLCFTIFLQLDQNWMSPSHVSQVASAARESGDIAFLHRMESSTSPLMREAALGALALHHVLEGEIDAAKQAAVAFDKEFGIGNEKWSIYRRLTHENNVKDAKRRFAATQFALEMVPIESKDYAFIAREHAKLLGKLYPDAALPADWMELLKRDPKLLLQVELEHAFSRGSDTMAPPLNSTVQNTATETPGNDNPRDRPQPDAKAQSLGEAVHRRLTAFTTLSSTLISTQSFTSYYGDPKGVIGLKDARSLEYLRDALSKRDFDKSLSTKNDTWAWDNNEVVSTTRQKYVYEGEPYDQTSERTWDGKRGWWRDSSGSFGRFRTFADTFEHHYFMPSQFLHVGDHRFAWVQHGKEPTFFLNSTIPVEYANYQSLPDAEFAGERCHVIRSIPREEQFWISQATGRLRGCLTFISQGKFTWMHEMESTRKLAGRSFDSREEFGQWFDQALTDAQRFQLHCEFLYLHQANQHPKDLIEFSDYREVASGVEIPMTEWWSSWMHADKQYRYDINQTVVREVNVTPEIQSLVDMTLPKKGDAINDWRFATPVNYTFDPEMAESVIHAMVDKAMQEQASTKKQLDRILKPLRELVGKPAPKLDGQWITDDVLPGSFQEKPTLLHFWATWCGPCKNDIPRLNRMQENGWAIVGVHAPGTDTAKIEKAIEESGIKYPVLLGHETDGVGSQTDKITGYPIKMFPCCVLVGKDGNVKSVGSLSDVRNSDR